MSAQPKPKPKLRPSHLEPQQDANLATYSLLRAVYMDDLDRARAILEADPQQVNQQEPFAGLTPLHIAVFRQNAAMVRLLARHPNCKGSITDNFGRQPTDMLAYTANREIFDIVTSLTTPETEPAWRDEVYHKGRPSGGIMHFGPKLTNEKS